MQIICPNCETSYDVAASSIGPQGRTVRCVRCRETWLAHAQEPATADAVGESEQAAAPDTAAAAYTETETASETMPEPAIEHLPTVDSPSIATQAQGDADWSAEPVIHVVAPKARRIPRLPVPKLGLPKLRLNLPVAAAAMAGLCLALIIWRQDVVRAMPQTAGFFNTLGLHVNLRQMAFRDVTILTETVNGAQVYVIEGAIVATGKSPVDIPRLRFVVTDDKGQEIYAWNAQPEQPKVEPGERVAFKSRLASPPAEARNVTVRFFNRRDLNSGKA